MNKNIMNKKANAKVMKEQKKVTKKVTKEEAAQVLSAGTGLWGLYFVLGAGINDSSTAIISAYNK